MNFLSFNNKNTLDNAPANLRDILQVAIGNAKSKDGETVLDWNKNPIQSKGRKSAIEFILPSKFMMHDRENSNDPYKIMADFSIRLAEYLIHKNQTVFPTINYKSWMSLPSPKSNKRISWHSHGSRKNHLHLKIGTYPGFVSADSQGFSGWSNFSKIDATKQANSTIEKTFSSQLSQAIISSKSSKYTQPGESNMHLTDEKYLFVALQMPSDVVSKLAWINTTTILKILAEFAPYSKRKIIVKRHPKCKSIYVTALINRFKNIPNLHFSNDNIHDLIKNSDAVLTVNSGVGAEALLHRKPIIVTGACDYIAAAIRVKNPTDLLRILSMEVIEMPAINLDAFIYNYCKRYMIGPNDAEAMRLNIGINNLINEDECRIDK